MKHTSGPWVAIEAECGKLIQLRSDIDDQPVATLVKSSINPVDIHLIATAPDLFEALSALLSNDYVDLGDIVYQIRERELLGWDGPAVIAWSDAVVAARNAVEKARGAIGR